MLKYIIVKWMLQWEGGNHVCDEMWYGSASREGGGLICREIPFPLGNLGPPRVKIKGWNALTKGLVTVHKTASVKELDNPMALAMAMVKVIAPTLYFFTEQEGQVLVYFLS